MDAIDFARWTRVAAKGGIGTCTALQDCGITSPRDLPLSKDDEVIVLARLSEEDCYLGYCEGVIGEFQGSTVHFHGILKQPVSTRPIHSGGFCEIYVGKLQRGGHVEKVAMKLLRMFSTDLHAKKVKKKFRHEVELWRSLKHPNVLAFYGICELDEHRWFMVSPWALGGTSLEYLQRNPRANRGRLLWQTAIALEYLHSGRDALPIAHGDLKADNVLISATGDALLCDFGLSRFIQDSLSHSSSLNLAGHIRFTAPELIMPPKGPSAHPTRPTPTSDVFAFASLMLQVYSERLPFSDLTDVQSMFEIIAAKLPPRPEDPIGLERGLTDDIWTLMTECWHFEAEMRPIMALIAFQLKRLVPDS